MVITINLVYSYSWSNVFPNKIKQKHDTKITTNYLFLRWVLSSLTFYVSLSVTLWDECKLGTFVPKSENTLDSGSAWTLLIKWWWLIIFTFFTGHLCIFFAYTKMVLYEFKCMNSFLQSSHLSFFLLFNHVQYWHGYFLPSLL